MTERNMSMTEHDRTEQHITEHPEQNINITEQRTFDEYDITQQHSTEHDRTEHENDGT